MAFFEFTSVSRATMCFQSMAPPFVPIATLPMPEVFRMPVGSPLLPEPLMAAFSKRSACASVILLKRSASTSKDVCLSKSLVVATDTDDLCGVIVNLE